ncbi:Serine/threonine protein kinase PrkC, regulator of stationary phase [hydrothermal vent metagenome]|uniref:Serine/threonine protein kinase PrkC, regulator of stationary phase n=1 Tax=hydrothermal vent metagenome TaxID=652676 RepID=A0A3B0X111_9ZZZZ
MNSTDTILQTPAANREPTAFGKYQVQYKIGQGAMGAVYKAYDPSIDRMVAVKTISPGVLLSDSTGEFKERFLREIRATGKINHPNIISVFDSGELDGNPFFVMEYVEGKELKDYLIDNSSVSLEHAIRIFCQILDALSYSHEAGIVHRDIKPSNIFIDVNGNVKIADFGVARQSNSNLTQTGSIIGTPGYMSPEQCQGKDVDYRSDLFSAAVVFYEMITGEKCFGGTSAHIVMHRILNNSPEKPSILNICIPEHIDRAVLKALSKNPSDRYPSALEFKAAIESSSSARYNVAQKTRTGKYLVASVAIIAVIAAIVVVTALMVIDNAEKSDLVNMKDEEVTQWQQSTIKPVPLSDQNKILRLLKVGKAHTLVGRYVVPQGSNAYSTYKLILDIDPGNVAAHEGMRQVKDGLLKQIESWVEEGNTERAKDNITAAIDLYPEESQFREMLGALD